MKNLLMFLCIALFLVVSVSATALPVPSFNTTAYTMVSPVTASRYVPNNDVTLTINITGVQNMTSGIEFNGVNYTLTNSSLNSYSYTLDDVQTGQYTYYFWGHNYNETANYYNKTGAYTYLVNERFVSGQSIYNTLESSGSGVSIFLQYLSLVLPSLILAIGIIGVIVLILVSVAHGIKSYIRR